MGNSFGNPQVQPPIWKSPKLALAAAQVDAPAAAAGGGAIVAVRSLAIPAFAAPLRSFLCSPQVRPKGTSTPKLASVAHHCGNGQACTHTLVDRFAACNVFESMLVKPRRGMVPPPNLRFIQLVLHHVCTPVATTRGKRANLFHSTTHHLACCELKCQAPTCVLHVHHLKSVPTPHQS